MKHVFKTAFIYSVYIFAAIGFTLTAGFFAVKFGITNERGIIDVQKNSFITDEKGASASSTEGVSEVYTWKETEDWQALKTAITKDRNDIYKAAAQFDVEPRMIAAIIMVEQMRLFGDNRETFKTIFAPLKILGVQSQFSWGVVGIKRETAIAIEQNLKDRTSPFYPGKKYENLLDFVSTDSEQERFERLTDDRSRLYSYLYTAALLRQIQTQWLREGYQIDDKPSILATLFNIGFKHSKPNDSPKSGGATITVDGKNYSFGSLAAEFYSSDELIGYFPR